MQPLSSITLVLYSIWWSVRFCSLCLPVVVSRQYGIEATDPCFHVTIIVWIRQWSKGCTFFKCLSHWFPRFVILLVSLCSYLFWVMLIEISTNLLIFKRLWRKPKRLVAKNVLCVDRESRLHWGSKLILTLHILWVSD